MAANNRKNGVHQSAVIERGLAAGLEQAAATGREAEVELLLNDAHEKMVTELCNVLGLSARSVLNAALRYALHYARALKTHPTKLQAFPKRLNGHIVRFVLTAETLSKLREAQMLDDVRGCTLAGIKLLHEKTLKIKAAG